MENGFDSDSDLWEQPLTPEIRFIIRDAIKSVSYDGGDGIYPKNLPVLLSNFGLTLSEGEIDLLMMHATLPDTQDAKLTVEDIYRIFEELLSKPRLHSREVVLSAFQMICDEVKLPGTEFVALLKEIGGDSVESDLREMVLGCDGMLDDQGNIDLEAFIEEFTSI